MVDVYQEVVDKLCQIHSDDEKCAEILEILAIEDAKCGGRVNSAMWRMMKNLIAFDRPFKSYSEKIVLSAEKMPPRPAAPLGQTMDVGVTNLKKREIDPESQEILVDGDLAASIGRYALYYNVKKDNYKRSAIPLTPRLAATFRHGDNKSIEIGDEIVIRSWSDEQRKVTTHVVKIIEELDAIILESDGADLCDKDLISNATIPRKGMQYLLMGYSILHEKTSHQSLSTGIIVSDATRRLRYMGSSGSFKGDSGGSCWDENGQLIGMQIEVEKVPHTKDDKGRPASPASGGRCCIVAMRDIFGHIQDLLPPDSDVDWTE
ncbi:unnamed protein product [Caenorhabditis bovis]|uniref:Peptidase S1 domain-containing protein n=1 Tax=Caenorhabditis bovis TaxID=2654633 RepID=A0A8S1EAP3_9PELO|nr:unnamed protein product [Caenorhabditis bovis]